MKKIIITLILGLGIILASDSIAQKENKGKGKLPEVSFSSKDHTTAKVPVYSRGPRAKLFTGRMDNTDIHKKIIKAARPAKPLFIFRRADTLCTADEH